MKEYIVKKGEEYLLVNEETFLKDKKSYERYYSISGLNNRLKLLLEQKKYKAVFEIAEKIKKWLRDFDFRTDERNKAIESYLGIDEKPQRNYWDKTIYFIQGGTQFSMFDFIVVHQDEIEEKAMNMVEQYYEFGHIEYEDYNDLDQEEKKKLITDYIKTHGSIKSIEGGGEYHCEEFGDYYIFASHEAKRQLLRIQLR